MRRIVAAARLLALSFCAFLLFSSQLFTLGETLRRGLPRLGLRLIFSSPDALLGTHGLLPQIINTLLLTALSLAVSMPPATALAVWLFRSRGRAARFVSAAVSSLGSVPSAVYGLFGYLVFGGALSLGYSILSGALTAALLILPPAVFLINEALASADIRAFRAAIALGSGEGRAVLSVLLPSAGAGIRNAVFLSAARVAAESSALLLTSGIGDAMPSDGLVPHILRSGATLTVGMYRSVLEGENDLAFSAGVVLLLLVFTAQSLGGGRNK